ncbi:MAG: hypothetical protein ACI4UU_02600 [Clostridia bacterium]
MKYKIKKRKKAVMTWQIVLLLVVIFFLVSTSYSLLSEKLFINGTATGTNQNGDMPVILVPESGTDQYVVTDLASNVATIESQYIENNVLVVNYLAKSNKGKPTNTNINIDFKNSYPQTIENGTTTYEITGNTAFFNNSQPTITTTTSINSGENGTVSIQLRNLKFNSLTTSATCKIQVTYQMNGQNIEFYIQLNFTK